MPGKILFVNQPVSLDKRYAAQSRFANHTTPLTLCHLASLTRKHGFPSAILDAAMLGLTMEETVNKIVEEEPSYLALYATTVTIEEAAILTTEAKRWLPHLLVLVGGIHLTAVPLETMQHYRTFDIGGVGEGDLTILHVLEALEQGSHLDSVPGIVFRRGNDLILTEASEPVADLNGLPMPAFDLLKGFPRAYIPPFFGYTTLPIATAVVSRGCPAQCLFCRAGIFGDRNLRQYSPKYIVELMRYLKTKHGVRQVLFYDDDFAMFKKHTKELCERLIQADIGVTWSCNTRVIDVDQDLLQIMARAGCWQISYGVESGSQRVLNAMRKGTTLGLIDRAMRWTKEAGIRTNGYFLLGFPTETKEEIEETIRFAKRLPLDIFQCTLFTPFPSLPFSKEVEKFGKWQSKEWSDLNIFNPVFVTGELTADELEYFKRKAWREFYFRPGIQLNLLFMLWRHPAVIGHYLRTALGFAKFVFSRLDRGHGFVAGLPKPTVTAEAD